MGFIKWHGEKEDHYEDVIAFAKENEKLETAALGEAVRRKNIAEYFQLPDASAMKDAELLQLILREQKMCEKTVNGLYQSLPETTKPHAEEFQKDFWMYSLSAMLSSGKMDSAHQCKFVDAFLNDVFKQEYPISAMQHMTTKKASVDYSQYFEEAFGIRSGSYISYWQWIGELCRESQKIELGKKLVELYCRWELHIALYMNFIAPGQEIGKKLPSQYKRRREMIYQSLKYRSSREELIRKMHNPLGDLLAVDIGRISEAPSEQRQTQEESEIAKPFEIGKKPVIDKDRYETILKEETLEADLQAINMLLKCKMDLELRSLLERICERCVVLKDSSTKFKNTYDLDVTQFTEYYIPETCRLVVTYLEYADLQIGKSILDNVKTDTMQAVNTLLTGINGKIDELYRYVSIEAKAQAKAVDAMLLRDGYVNNGF